MNTTTTNLIAAVFGSIVASIAVSSFYNEELHKAMDKYNKIGLVNYFDNFEDAHSIIKSKISNAKTVDIFVMYGDSFLNTSTKAIQSVLAKDNSKFRYVIYSIDNKFIESYGNHWGVIEDNPKYNEAGLKLKIQGVKNDLKRLVEKKHQNCSFDFYEIQSSPISYSFYRVDDELFFVPNKNIRSKEIKPAVFQFKKTAYGFSMFNKLISELELMINNKEIIKAEL
ncbi:MAG: hypothetical protein Q7U08_08660 [Flavobacteriaceae bacterium]|nr:hypothetical protein [Flavobacteriaceae bacterium]